MLIKVVISIVDKGEISNCDIFRFSAGFQQVPHTRLKINVHAIGRVGEQRLTWTGKWLTERKQRMGRINLSQTVNSRDITVWYLD